jgi:nucleoside-diphosphate-sugar epimerase
VVDAIIKSLHHPHSDIFNLGTEPVMPFRDFIRTAHRYCAPVPLWLIRSSQNLLWHWSSRGEDPAWIDGMRHSLAVDTRHAKNTLAWTPQYSSHDIIKLLSKH